MEVRLEKSKGLVVILEDDTTLATALKAAMERSGFSAITTSRTEEVLQCLQKEAVAAIFVDCLLPGTSGVDFIQSIRKNHPAATLDVILMSGLLTDNAFIKESLRTTQAVAFLKKPFEIEEAIKYVKPVVMKAQGQEEMSPRKALYQLFARSKVSVRDKRKTIEALEEIHAFDLPYLYSLLAETKSSGHLNIYSSKGDISGITFAEGQIVGVDIADQATYLGTLLIEAGFLQPEELAETLNLNSPKRIGERLLQGNLISPHAFLIALANQMSIRISRTIVDANIKVSFAASEIPVTEPSIDSDALSHFLHDWVASKINFKWLKSHYLPWGDNRILKSPTYDIASPFMKKPLLISAKPFLDEIASNDLTLNQILDTKKYPEETTYKALHLMFAKGFFIFVNRENKEDIDTRVKSLRKILAQFQGKNKLDTFEMMARVTGETESHPEQVFSEFQQLIGTEPSKDSQELHQLYTQVLAIAQSSFAFAKTGNKDKLREEIAKTELEKKMKAASQFEEAKNFLQRSQYLQALAILQKIFTMDSAVDKVRLYLIWAKIGVAETKKSRGQLLAEIETDLMQVPPEDKFDALYYFILGIFAKAKGDIAGAKKLIEKSIQLDANFIAARREITMMQSQAGAKKDVLNRDLKDLVSGFFKRK